MAYALTDLLRRWTTSAGRKRPSFMSDDEAYDFCREAYEKSGGVSADLLEAHKFYKTNFDEKLAHESGAEEAPHR